VALLSLIIPVYRVEDCLPRCLDSIFEQSFGDVEDGRIEHHRVDGVGAGRPVSDTFTFEEQPGLLDVLWIACNKVISRRFLLESGLTFGPGWYEDVAFVLPLMLLARRISLLIATVIPTGSGRPARSRRPRATGISRCSTSGSVFEFMDHHPDRFTQLRPLIFQRMIWHCLQVLGHPYRVPRAERRQFFARVTAQCRRHLPPGGVPVPEGRAWPARSPSHPRTPSRSRPPGTNCVPRPMP
jgi:hypothetical protein